MSLLPALQFESPGSYLEASLQTYLGEEIAGVMGAGAQVWLRRLRLGSAGVVVLIADYLPYLPRVGSSTEVADYRASPGPIADAVEAVRPRTKVEPSIARELLALSIAEQARELLAALSLNKTQLADILRVSRPTLYDWLDGKEPQPTNAKRLKDLLTLLRNAGIASSNPLSARFSRELAGEDGVTLLEALSTETIDEGIIVPLLREAKEIAEKAQSRRLAREARLRDLGFDEPSQDERRAHLAQSMAMKDWPKT